MDSTEALHDRLVALAEPELELLGIELVELEVLRGGGRLTLRFAVDKITARDQAESQIAVEECARASRNIARAIEAEDEETAFMPGRFTIEVSSPGIFRRLKTPAHFLRFEGRLAKFVVAGGAQLRGRLAAVTESSVDVVDESGETTSLNFDQIQKAHLDPDLDFGRRKP